MGRWVRNVAERLALDADVRPQLINDLPGFLDELAECLETPPEEWPKSASARSHGRHRVEIGLDIGGLAQEFSLVGETVLEMAEAEKLRVSMREAKELVRLIGRGTSDSVTEYAKKRDRQIAEETARHFSFVAHEIRTPLHTARLGLALMSQQGAAPSPYMARVDRALAQLSSLVDNSLVEARLQGQPQLHAQTIDVAQLIEAAIEDVRMAADRRNLAIEVEVEPLQVEVDPKLMLSALTNLITNAVKFTHAGGRLWIRALDREDHILFEVEDQCGGLPEDLPSRLFQPFVQVGDDRSGFGLGLMIVKQAVEAHGGAIRVVNRPGEGCSFVIELPRSQRT